jgi:hypothetical protein
MLAPAAPRDYIALQRWPLREGRPNLFLETGDKQWPSP